MFYLKISAGLFGLLSIINLTYGLKCPKISPCISPEDKSLRKEIDIAVKNHTVTVFSRTTCPFSKRVKAILRDNYHIKDLFIVEIDLHENMCGMLDCLNAESGIHTVPQVFVSGKFLGNHDIIKKLFESGLLDEILVDAKAI
uniref:Glutaredoxin domain-containing protein n=1 Tax=Acrobeloides nanus TaxID=290746 RepID=A0A914C4Q1_9BILA